MAKNFKGIVKVSDVQNEFDKLVQDLNTSVDEYNNIDEVKNIDYNKAGSLLGQLGYTLTVGGLKQFMQIYNGFCFGCKVFKTGNNQCKPTGGILVTENKFYRIPTDIVNGYGTMLFYDPKADKCLLGGTTKVTKTVALPVLTSNSSYGTVTASRNAASAYKITARTLKEKSGWNYGAIATYNKNFTKKLAANDASAWASCPSVTWKFPSKMIFKKGTKFTYNTVMGNADVPVMSLFSIYVNFAASGGSPNIGSWNIDVSGGYYYTITLTLNKDLTTDTIKFSFYFDSEFAISKGTTITVQNLRVSPNPTTTVIVADNDTHDDVYKIADLNWGKTSGDKLWLNDLPHSMY